MIGLLVTQTHYSWVFYSDEANGHSLYLPAFIEYLS